MDDEAPQQLQIHLDPAMAGGVWANFAAVRHSPHEFTLDFVRLDYGNTPPTGVVVARVNMSPLLVTELVQALQENWGTYAEKALPRDIYGEE